MKTKDIDDLIKIVEVISQINIPNYIISINSYEIIKTLEEIKLILPDVVGSKRFKEQDLLRAYQAGAIEQQSISLDSLDFEKLKELTKDSEKWYERYTE